MSSSELSSLSVEPSVLKELTPQQKERLTDILDGYLSAMGNGAPPRPDELLERHPELAGPLQMYLTSLAALHDAAVGFGRPTAVSAPAGAPRDSDERRLGDFLLVREVGRGGMGVVYEARQMSLGRRVALKVLPFAAILNSKQIARFQNEAQAAAQLHHPNIVPVFAVGTERGVHYYAMQFIDGQPLDRAIAQMRRRSRVGGNDPSAKAAGAPAVGDDVDTEEACEPTEKSFLTEQSANRRQYVRAVVRLGIQAAEALHAAHEYGVVHRDIKPSNLLLDGDGKLWVTDFGLARCQTDRTLTKTGDVVGTTRYMSPEQALGQSALVDHRTDVYSLGATLYELLTLRPAFPGEDGPALVRRIELQEPTRLRQLHPETPPDLETVIFKAMAKSREERYATAQQFADDLRRVLEGKPPIAKPPAAIDRMAKWARRHKRVVGAVAAACLLAVVGLGVSVLLVTREKIKAQRNYERAEANFRSAHSAVDHFGARLAQRLADVPGAEQVRRELLQDTLEYYGAFVEQAGRDPALRAELALTYSEIGSITGAIGSTEDAIAAHEKALAILKQLVLDEPAVAEHRRRLALCQNNLALTLVESGRTDDARRAYGEAIRLQKQLVAASPRVQQYSADLSLSHSNLGLLQSQTGETDKAAESFQEAIRLQQALVSDSPSDPEHLRNLAASYNNLGALYAGQQPLRAIELHKKGMSYQERAAAERPGELDYQSGLALTLNNLGAAQSCAQQFPAAAASYRQAIAIQTQLVRAAPAHKSYRRDLAVSCNNLGMIQSKLRDTADAERSFRQALELQELLVSQYPHDVTLQSSLGGVCNNLGIVLEEIERTDEAAESYRKAVEHQQVAYSRAPQVSRYRLFLSKHYYNYGRVLRQLGQADQAARAAMARKELWPNDPYRLFTVAEELALACKLLGDAKRPGVTADECAAVAIKTLRQAVAAGLRLPADLGSNPTFAALRNRAEFVELAKN